MIAAAGGGRCSCCRGEEDLDDDEFSPYFTDKDGNLKQKWRIEDNPDLQQPLKDDEEIQ